MPCCKAERQIPKARRSHFRIQVLKHLCQNSQAHTVILQSSCAGKTCRTMYSFLVHLLALNPLIKIFLDSVDEDREQLMPQSLMESDQRYFS